MAENSFESIPVCVAHLYLKSEKNFLYHPEPSQFLPVKGLNCLEQNKTCILGSRRTLYFHPQHLQPHDLSYSMDLSYSTEEPTTFL